MNDQTSISDFVRDALDAALRNEPHVHTGDVDNVNVRPAGNSESAALRRLRKDRADLHAEVLAGNLKAHAAMVQAGSRDPLKLSAAAIGKLATEYFVWSGRDGASGDRLLDALRADLALSQT